MPLPRKSTVSSTVIMSERDRNIYFFAYLPLAKLLRWAFLDLGCISGLIALPPLQPPEMAVKQLLAAVRRPFVASRPC